MTQTCDQHRNLLRIIAIGNPLAGDDGVGISVAHKLMNLHLSGVDIMPVGLAPLDVLDSLAGAETAVLIDAVRSGKDAGTILRFEIPEDLPQLTTLAWAPARHSTHKFGLAEALSLGNELGVLPSHITVYGIELGQVHMGASLSPKVQQAMETVVAQIIDGVKRLGCTNSSFYI